MLRAFTNVRSYRNVDWYSLNIPTHLLTYFYKGLFDVCYDINYEEAKLSFRGKYDYFYNMADYLKHNLDVEYDSLECLYPNFRWKDRLVYKGLSANKVFELFDTMLIPDYVEDLNA